MPLGHFFFLPYRLLGYVEGDGSFYIAVQINL